MFSPDFVQVIPLLVIGQFVKFGKRNQFNILPAVCILLNNLLFIPYLYMESGRMIISCRTGFKILQNSNSGLDNWGDSTAAAVIPSVFQGDGDHKTDNNSIGCARYIICAYGLPVGRINFQIVGEP